jgi:hypothetical protein
VEITTNEYLYKLRHIEILVQAQLETLEADGKDDVTLREIQKILYSTEVCYQTHNKVFHKLICYRMGLKSLRMGQWMRRRRSNYIHDPGHKLALLHKEILFRTVRWTDDSPGISLYIYIPSSPSPPLLIQPNNQIVRGQRNDPTPHRTTISTTSTHKMINQSDGDIRMWRNPQKMSRSSLIPPKDSFRSSDLEQRIYRIFV